MDYGEAIQIVDPGSDWEGDDATLTCPEGCCIEVDCPECSCGHINPLMAAGLV